MLLETLALGSVLYVGFKSFKKQGNTEKSGKNLSTNTTTQMKSVVEDQFTQMVEESDDKKSSAKLTFKEKNDREIVSASIARVLSSVGSWLYLPLGFLSIPFSIYASKQYHKEAYELIKQGKISPETLISLSIVGAIIPGYFFIASLISIVSGLSMKLTALVTHDSRQQLISAFKQQPNFVWLMVKGVEVRIPFNELQRDNIVVVCTGEMIPADGTVIEGMASVDQHILTGEARPVDKESGEEVFASTVVLS